MNDFVLRSIKSIFPAKAERVAETSQSKPKIFCVGRNKTGTTSLAAALRQLGITVGKQTPAERLLKDWAVRDFRKIIAYCETADAFQDVPFSLPYTFVVLDQHFPGSKFVLTVRDNPDQWYTSLVSFHRKIWGDNISSLSRLKQLPYPAYKGYPHDARALVHDCVEDNPYDRDTLIAHYNFHNAMVRDYFRHRPEDLLELNVGEAGAYRKLCDFLGKPCPSDQMPWENKT
jgi:hypothetical protein